MKPFFPNLDASRFLAFLLVFFAHCLIPGNSGLADDSFFQSLVSYSKLGFLGLEYFFVLSSFLITYLILLEIKKNTKLNVKHFLIRRALRVWPLYFLIVGIGYSLLLVARVFPEASLEPLPNPIYFLLFIVNFYTMNHGIAFLFFLAFLWSISIEEQFYLFWAIVMNFYSKRVFPYLCLILILVSWAFRYYHLEDEPKLYFHTISTLGNFGIGALAAYYSFYSTSFVFRLNNIPDFYKRLFYFMLLVSIFCFHAFRKFDVFLIFQRSFYSLLFAFYILIQAFAQRPLFLPGKFKVFNYLGKISYGLYCFHGLVITLLVKLLDLTGIPTENWQSYILFPLVIFALSVGISTLSYSYIERPFLKLKSRFGGL